MNYDINMYKVTYNKHNSNINNPMQIEKVAYVEDIISIQKYRGRVLKIEPMVVTYLPEYNADMILNVYAMIDLNIK